MPSANNDMNEEYKQNTPHKPPFRILPGMLKWERICIYIVAVLSFLTITTGVSIIDALLCVLLNSAILYFVFRLGNSVYKKINK